jgi:hypothetical protein
MTIKMLLAANSTMVIPLRGRRVMFYCSRKTIRAFAIV